MFPNASSSSSCRAFATKGEKTLHGRWKLAWVVSAGLTMVALPLAGCAQRDHAHNMSIRGSLPRLGFTMVRARDAKIVTEADYRGKIVLLYFGYTYCPDACPTTLSNMANLLNQLGPAAGDVRILFVTVDPQRDTLPVLKRYANAFSSRMDSLRGDPDQLAALARRYRVAYSAIAARAGSSAEVTHSSGVYAFDRGGESRLLISSLSTAEPDLAGTRDDIQHLLK